MIFEKKFKIEIGFGMGLHKDGSAITSLESRLALQEIERDITNLTGGCTTIRTRGSWISPTGHRFVEEGACVFFFLPTFWPGIIENVVSFIKTTLDQEAVAVTVTEVQFAIV